MNKPTQEQWNAFAQTWTAEEDIVIGAYRIVAVKDQFTGKSLQANMVQLVMTAIPHYTMSKMLATMQSLTVRYHQFTKQ